MHLIGLHDNARLVLVVPSDYLLGIFNNLIRGALLYIGFQYIEVVIHATPHSNNGTIVILALR